ncbi:ABC transporter permease [Egicoccus halophilus]|uniref:Peptide ABC transporter permease n=1 Tax=Egicoccus halophilus TaxID=1670830 RepID=A0A8J3ESZ0_9ACTN|nr:ABC transporter permease [Egicoccus halophilus]GGI04515.1 peptide ABC transporter permease [Egicoccus halophilus]
MSESSRKRAAAQDTPPDQGSGGNEIATDDAGLHRTDHDFGDDYSDGSQIVIRSQWQLFRRKFLSHKLAMSSLVFLLVVVIAAVFAEQIAPYAYDEINVIARSTPPTFEGWHLFGTDQLGRDYFSRVIYGTRVSLQVASIVAIVTTVLGTVIGSVAGYYRGWVDAILMRLTDLIVIVPLLAVLLIAAAFLGQGQPTRIAIIIALLVWPSLARIVRGVFLGLREKEYVQAARACGAGDLRIIARHMLPNTIGPILVNMTLTLASAILLEATLAFLGFGVNPPTPALGLLINEGRSSMQTQWWLVVMPGVAIVAIALAINFIGDGLRDALDPTQQEK